MLFFLPDSQDFVDPSFDFERETRSENRVRHRDDLYAHEVFAQPPFDGILVSKAIVDGLSVSAGKYTLAQRHRLLREGVRGFFRLDERQATAKTKTMGDCGAFTYVKEERPPFTVQSVIDFYSECGFGFGISVDHVILGYDASTDDDPSTTPPEFLKRLEITLELASEFKKLHKAQKCRFHPVGVAQGWSPKSYAKSVKALQAMGYDYIALGGMVPLKTPEILESLAAISKVKKPDTRFHLLGVTRTDEVRRFESYGVASFDSTSPLRQAFKDDRDNYYTLDRTYIAIRVPQAEGNPKLQRQIQAGKVNNDKARKLERLCLDRLRAYDRDATSMEPVLEALAEYETLCDGKAKHTDLYAEVLRDRPWKKCSCEVCRGLGIHVMLFRGAERNRRRGFHNIYVFAQRLRDKLRDPPRSAAAAVLEKKTKARSQKQSAFPEEDRQWSTN